MSQQQYVLDVWAFLALLQGEEPAATRVKQLLENAQNEQAEVYISILSLSKVYSCIGQIRGEEEARETLEYIKRLAITTISATDERVWAATRLKTRFAVPFADVCAIVVAEELDATLVTDGPNLVQFESQIQIEWLSQSRN